MNIVVPIQSVEADIHYQIDDGRRVAVNTAELTQSAMNLEARRMTIMDRSSARMDTHLDREGYVLQPHISKVTDFTDREQLEHVHLPELRSMLLELTGADRVEFPASVGSMRRGSRSTAARANDESRPVHFAHIDASREGMVNFMDQIFPDRPQNVRRWAYYNLWRAVSAGPLDEPLAVLDARSLEPGDTIPYDVRFPDGWRLESLLLRHNPRHRWTYFSGMTRDDVLVFRTYDSDPANAAAVAHTAFADPSCPSDAPPRESYETRAYLCWYD